MTQYPYKIAFILQPLSENRRAVLMAAKEMSLTVVPDEVDVWAVDVWVTSSREAYQLGVLSTLHKHKLRTTNTVYEEPHIKTRHIELE